MSHSLPPQELAIIRDRARLLVQRADDHEHRLGALVAATETHVRFAESALSEALNSTQTSIEHFKSLLTQLQASRDYAETARQLCAVAHEQCAAAGLLLTQLSGAVRSGQSAPEHPRRDAVLVVDDYQSIRDVIAGVLRNAGFDVRTAANGLEGLLTAYEMQPVVIVMDVVMPVLDGIEATRLIKASEVTREARVIAYTSNAALDAGVKQALFAAVLKKPATPAVLLAAVQQAARH